MTAMSQDIQQMDSPVVQNRPGLTSAVMLMDNNLHEHDIESLKFLCQGLVVGSKLKRVTAAHELASILQSAKLVSENSFFLLADLLQCIQRVDVLESIGYDEAEVMFQRGQQLSKIEPFSVLLFHISEELNDADVKRVYSCERVPRSRSVSSGLDLFSFMIQQRSIGPSNVGRLISIFQEMERQDILEMINRFVETGGQSVMEDLEEAYRMKLMALRCCQTLSQLAQQPTGMMRNGSGSANGHNGRDREQNIHNTAVSQHTSMENHPPSLPQAFPPCAPQPAAEPNQPPPGETPMDLTESPPAPSGDDQFDERIISWQLLDILSKKIPAQYWPDFVSRLGMHLETQGWDTETQNYAHNMALLRRWLQQPDTQAMDSVHARLLLVQALHYAGPTLMAQEIAELLNVDITSALQESLSSGTSVSDINETSSTAPAAHIPEDHRGQAASAGAGDGQRLPMVTRPSPQHHVEPAASPIPYYRMDRIPRGLCVIINNRNFYVEGRDARTLEDREGTEVDRARLKETFENLNFMVVTKDDCSDTQMIQTMTRIAAEDHSGFDCFVCCFLTHGNPGKLYGVNGMAVPIRDLTSPFRSQACPSLAGKPKLFFMQACQGAEKQRGHENDMERDCSVETDGPQEVIPNEADFLLGYATVPGFASFRSRSQGSWYITTLTKSLNKYAYSHDILDILTLVNFEVGQANADMKDGVLYKQSPAPMYSLRKKLIFSRPS